MKLNEVCYLPVPSVTDPDPFGTDPDHACQFDTDPDPYLFKEVMYQNSTFCTSLLDFPCQ